MRLTDIKKGSSDPVDPPEQVGTWTILNNATTSAAVKYMYGSSSHTYKVFSNGGSSYDLCDASTGALVRTVTVQTAPCP